MGCQGGAICQSGIAGSNHKLDYTYEHKKDTEKISMALMQR